jgi:arylsulfatase A-like enzyme
MLGLAHFGFRLNDYHQMIGNHLLENHIDTALCGIEHEGGNKDERVYRYVYRSKSKDFTEIDTEDTKEAVSYIKSSKVPFYLNLGFINTHREFPQNGDVNADFIMPPGCLPDTLPTRKDMAEFFYAVKIVDNCVGDVLDAIKSAGIEDETAVFFTTDHGIAFPNMKCNLYDGGIGISLIAKLPGCKTGANNALISNVDIFPTICDIFDIEKPGYLQGKSFYRLLTGESDKINDEIFSEVNFHVAREPMRCVRTERYKLIKLLDDCPDKPVLLNCDESFSKDMMYDAGYFNIARDRTMLFDLYLDPAEKRNVAADENYSNILCDLEKRLHDWMVRTDDPALKGPVNVPDGAFVKQNINKNRCLSHLNEIPDETPL